MSYRAIEKLVQCPFNPVHQILPHRLPAHIIKCWKNYPDSDMKPCPFNATHIIKIPLMQAHVLECPDHGVVERDMYRILELYFAGQRLEEQQQREELLQSEGACALPVPPPPCSEDWDSELVDSSYNPEDYTIYMEATRPPPPGLGKAARREWRENEVRRVEDIKAGKIPVEAIGHGKYKAEETQNCGVSNVENVMRCNAKELRRPRIAANFGVQMDSSEIKSPKTKEYVDENGKPDRKAIIKEKRILEKRLHAIQKLEKKVADGNQLTHEERIKIGRKMETERLLADLLEGVNLDEL